MVNTKRTPQQAGYTRSCRNGNALASDRPRQQREQVASARTRAFATVPPPLLLLYAYACIANIPRIAWKARLHHSTIPLLVLLKLAIIDFDKCSKFQFFNLSLKFYYSIFSNIEKVTVTARYWKNFLHLYVIVVCIL